jgi:hypothetical protein
LNLSPPGLALTYVRLSLQLYGSGMTTSHRPANSHACKGDCSLSSNCNIQK